MRHIVRLLTSKVTVVLLAATVLFTFSNAPFAAAKAKQAPGSARSSAASLTQEVDDQLVNLPLYTLFDHLEYKVDGNNVTLSGQVTQPVLKTDAEKAVKSIAGVGAVDNQIQVLPVSAVDSRIRRAEFRAIYSFPSLQMYALRAVPPIHIIVEKGHVTLEGAVATQSDKDAAGIRAKTVSGVFSVTNNLQVDKANP